MKSLRWETGQIYHKIMADWDNGKQQKEKEILKAFYYGWNLDQSGSGATGSEYSGAGGRISDDKLKYFTRDLIFSYLLRNELEFVPKITNVQYSTKVQAEQASDTHIQSLGSQNKFGEIYTWARMMPYIQGILMFILAGAYPIVCVVFLIPGAHKVIITWAAFWAWVKFWDLGFAIVTVIERSVWGMLGNSTHAAAVNNTLANIVEGSGISSIDVTCKSGPLGSCVFPNIKASGGASSAADIFDKGTAIGLSLNYGVYNGYYIYIMAALYMAVPFICGQVILQGKHGVGQLASMMTGGAEKAAGGAAETSAKSKMSADIMNTAGIAKRQVQANEASKYAINALDAGNKAAREGLLSTFISSQNQGIDNKVKAAVFNIELVYDKTTLIIQRKIDNSLTCSTISSSGTITNSEVINNISGKIEYIHINSVPSIQNTYVHVDDIITFTSDTDNNLPTILPTQSLINNNVVVTSNSTTYATI